MKPSSVLISAISAFSLIGCTVGPDYSEAKAPASAAAPFIAAASLTTTGQAVSLAPPDDHWWQLYRDPVLDRLITDALAANTDIRVAVANLARARSQLRGARNDLFPQTDVTASANYNRIPNDQRLPGEKRELGFVDAGLDVSYEVDLFGRVRREIEAANGDVAAAAADADAVRVAVVAETARAYADAASSAQQVAVAERIVDLLDRSMHVTERRFEVGRSTKLDVVRIGALRDQRRAFIGPLQAERESALFRLATLTGRIPRDLPPEVALRTTTPRLDQPIPVGDGRSLLARRPDVRAAERRLAADTARIGVATADLYPRISFGGSIGSNNTSLADMFGGGPLRWMVGPLVSWSFPNQEAIRARIGIAEADSQASLARFDGTILQALQETESALSAYAHELERHAALQAARDEATAAARISQARQREGQLDFLNLLDAERTFAEAEADLAASDARLAATQIALFQALGGGWQNGDATAGTRTAAQDRQNAASHG